MLILPVVMLEHGLPKFTPGPYEIGKSSFFAGGLPWASSNLSESPVGIVASSVVAPWSSELSGKASLASKIEVFKLFTLFPRNYSCYPNFMLCNLPPIDEVFWLTTPLTILRRFTMLSLFSFICSSLLFLSYLRQSGLWWRNSGECINIYFFEFEELLS